MKPPKISVVIPSFNKAKYISQTLDSIVKQNYQNLEVIIQDGDSTDGSVEIIKKYADKYPGTIKWESKKDKGQLDAVNKGLKKVVGDIIAFINADDVYENNTFDSISSAYLNNPNVLWFAGRATVIDEKGKETAKLVTRYKNFLLSLNWYPLLLVTNYLMQPSVFMTRRSYTKYGPFTGTKDFLTEYDLWLRIGKTYMPKIININLSKFRIEPTTKTKRMFKQLLKEDRKIVKKYTSNPLILLFHQIHNLGRIIIGRFV